MCAQGADYFHLFLREEILADCRKTGSAALGESVRKRRKNNIDKGSAFMRF